MLIGEHLHVIDEKKRLSLPKKFRDALGKNVVITRGLDNCLFVYSITQWKEFAGKLSQLPMGQHDSRSITRFMLAGAVETPIDKSGRILIPDFLKSFANLSAKVVVAGMIGRVELWSEKEWAKYKKSMEKNADAMAEKLGEFGMI